MSIKGRISSYSLTFAKDLIFLGPFFIGSFLLIKGNVPSENPLWIAFWGGMVAFSMASVAWLALQMFKVVLFDQMAMNKLSKPRK
jgi:hypothetical protein